MKNKLFLLFLVFVSFNSFGLEETCDHPGLGLFDEKASLGLADITSDIKPKLQYKGFVSPADLRKYSANTIAELLIDRIQEGCDKVRGGNDAEDMSEHSEVMMMVNDRLYDSIDKYGLQNQHVTATTEGCSCRDSRYDAETKMIGANIGYGSKSKDILPKYSGLNVLKKSHFNSSGSVHNGASHYGNTAIVFKDNISERTTFTPWDSLGVKDFRGSPIMSSLKFKDKIDSGKHFKCSYSYCEAQIWGKVTLDDVKYVLIPKGVKVPEVFKKRGVPVYYKKDGKKGTMAWEKGEVAFKGKGNPEYKSKKIEEYCHSCNTVVKKINNHHLYKNWLPIKLQNMLSPELNPDLTIDHKREILGELAVKQFPGKQKFFEEKLKSDSDYLNSTIYMQALSEFPDSKVLRERVLSNIKEISSSGTWGRYMHIMMSLSIALEVEPLKSDKEIQSAIKDEVKKSPSEYIKKFYQYLTSDKNMCDDLE